MNSDTNQDFDFQQQISCLEKKLYLSALSILRNEEDAKDALQETIYISYIKINSLRDKKAFALWVTKILVHESFKIYNRRKSYVEFSECENKLFAPAYEGDYMFFDIISRLKKDEKIIVILRFYNDFSIEQISKILKLPLSTVKSRLYRALKKIKNQLEA